MGEVEEEVEEEEGGTLVEDALGAMETSLFFSVVRKDWEEERGGEGRRRREGGKEKEGRREREGEREYSEGVEMGDGGKGN